MEGIDLISTYSGLQRKAPEQKFGPLLSVQVGLHQLAKDRFSLFEGFHKWGYPQIDG